jgi:hypothetical protein
VIGPRQRTNGRARSVGYQTHRGTRRASSLVQYVGFLASRVVSLSSRRRNVGQWEVDRKDGGHAFIRFILLAEKVRQMDGR